MVESSSHSNILWYDNIKLLSQYTVDRQLSVLIVTEGCVNQTMIKYILNTLCFLLEFILILTYSIVFTSQLILRLSTLKWTIVDNKIHNLEFHNTNDKIGIYK